MLASIPYPLLIQDVQKIFLDFLENQIDVLPCLSSKYRRGFEKLSVRDLDFIKKFTPEFVSFDKIDSTTYNPVFYVHEISFYIFYLELYPSPNVYYIGSTVRPYIDETLGFYRNSRKDCYITLNKCYDFAGIDILYNDIFLEKIKEYNETQKIILEKEFLTNLSNSLSSIAQTQERILLLLNKLYNEKKVD